jgi:hypothetical protein
MEILMLRRIKELSTGNSRSYPTRQWTADALQAAGCLPV